MNIPTHITGLRRQDLEEIARATNLKRGFAIKIEKEDDGIRISLDENDIKRLVWMFNQNGGFQVPASDIESVPI